MSWPQATFAAVTASSSAQARALPACCFADIVEMCAHTDRLGGSGCTTTSATCTKKTCTRVLVTSTPYQLSYADRHWHTRLTLTDLGGGFPAHHAASLAYLQSTSVHMYGCCLPRPRSCEQPCSSQICAHIYNSLHALLRLRSPELVQSIYMTCRGNSALHGASC
jgi:hypothetical protein